MLYRLRTSLSYRKFQRRTAAIASTPPLACVRTAGCEVHTMLGKRDLRMYLLAIKSLLWWVRDVSVVVHSDGSLDTDDFRQLTRHIPDIRLVSFREADQRADEALGTSPLLREWRTRDAAYRRLLDVELWRNAPKVIVLDSDVLTNHRPDEVAEWISHGTAPFMLGQPPEENKQRPDVRPSDHVQSHFLREVSALSAIIGAPSRFIQGATAGFCGYFDQISLSRIEAALKAALHLGLPMHQWGGDQCLVIYLLSIGGGERLPYLYYINYEPAVRDRAGEAKVIHFYGTHRFDGGTYPRLAGAAVRRLALPRQG